MRIFVSYRRGDVGGHAGRLSDALVQRLGAKNVFHDVTAIAAGRDFDSAIREALDACDAAVAVIGPVWLTASTPDGGRRLFEPDDYVRRELARVLQRDLPVVPVLVGGAALPAASDLPEDLRPLLRRQAIAVRDETWHADVDHLLRSLRGESTAPAAAVSSRRTGLMVATLAAAVVVVAALLVWRPWDGGSGTSPDERELTGCPDPGAPEWTALPFAPGAPAEDSRGWKLTVRSAGYRAYKPGIWQVVVDTVVVNDTAEVIEHASYGYASMIVAQRVFPQTCFDGRPRLVEPGTVGDGRTGYEVACQPGGRIELILGDDGGTRLLVSDGPSSLECAGG